MNQQFRRRQRNIAEFLMCDEPTWSVERFEVVGEEAAPEGIGGNSPCDGAIGGWKEPNACSCGPMP